MKHSVARHFRLGALLVLAALFGIGCGTTGSSPTNSSGSGPGIQVGQHSVSLSWDADASTVQGYYVYRGGQPGGPFSRVSSLLPGTTYTDSAVTSGQTYYYVVTALGTNSVESGYSNQATASVP